MPREFINNSIKNNLEVITVNLGKTNSSDYLLDSSLHQQIIPFASGTVYDSGGSSGNYSNGQNYWFIVKPPDAGIVQVDYRFSLTFNLDSNDFLSVFFPSVGVLNNIIANPNLLILDSNGYFEYNGSNSISFANPIEIFTNGISPWADAQIFSAYPAMLIGFRSDASGVSGGFKLDWRTTAGDYVNNTYSEKSYRVAVPGPISLKRTGVPYTLRTEKLRA